MKTSNKQQATSNKHLTKHSSIACVMLFLIPFITFNKSKAQVTVTTSTTWTALPSGYEDGITINSNVSLTIGLLTLNMNTGKSIILNTGSKLIFNGTVIQASGLGSNTWLGIQATGTGNEQFSTFPDPKTKNSTIAWSGVLDGSQTKVELTNNAQIKNAEIGIESIDGAIIRSRSSTFLNCEIGIQIDAYRSINNEKINACYFMQDQFLWDDDLESITSYDFSNLIGIKITDGGAINIGGCIFENTNSNAHCLDERGTGIKALNSDFTVERDGDRFCVSLDCSSGSEGAENCYSPAGGNGCEFSNLFRAIDYVSQSSRNDQFIARFSSFTDNFLSMFIERCNATGIFDNTFTTNRSNINSFYDNSGCSGSTYSSSAFLTNIDAFGAHQLRILQNDFTSDNQFVEHLKIFNCSSSGTSLIKANTISSSTAGFDKNDEVIGILSQGNNTDLNIYCNTFQDLGVDIWNVNGATLSNQPLQSGFDANNTFSNTSGIPDRYNIYNDGSSFNYVRKSSSEFIVRGGTNINTFNSPINNPPDCSIKCTDLTDIIDNSGVGIPETRKIYSIYPNPANYSIQVLPLGMIEVVKIELFKSEGSHHSNLEKDNLSFYSYALPDLPSGIYYLKIYSKKSDLVVTSKLMIVRN
jgi:hypothetical protein